jgi:4-hydroxy-tetrahydrodipicolinate synthase
VTSLTPDEMVSLAKWSREAVAGRVPVVAALFAEGVRPAVELGRRLAATGVDALLVMPPHHWLRFGKSPDESQAFVAAISEGVGLPLILHEYPLSTAAGYATDELVALARIPNVVAVKAGTRQMAAYGANIRALRRKVPDVTVLTCHDESMLATLVQGVDGALVAAGSIVPDELLAMHTALEAGDLATARAIDARITPIMDLLYGATQPGGRSHALLKAALESLGVLRGHAVRPPLTPLSEQDLVAVRSALAASGLLPTRAEVVSQG